MLPERVLYNGTAIVLQNLNLARVSSTVFRPALFTAEPAYEESKTQSPSILNSAANTRRLKKQQSLRAAFGVNLVETGITQGVQGGQMQLTQRNKKCVYISPSVNASKHSLRRLESLSKTLY